MSKSKENISFKVGQKVWLPNTKELAVITSLHREGLVYLDVEGMNIPVFLSDISADIPEGAETGMDKIIEEEEPGQKHDFIDGKELKQTGAFLIFIPGKLSDGEIVHYNCYLLNDTNLDIDTQFKISKGKSIFEEGHFILSKGSEKLITHFNADVLNDISEVEVVLKPLLPHYETFQIKQKISASSFMKKLKYFPPLKEEVFVYEVLKAFKEKNVKQVPEVKPDEFSFDADAVKRLMTDKFISKEQETMEYSNEVDLHAEVILHDMSGMDNAQILHAQVEHFHRALDKAIGSGQKIFYAIHGNGKGRLRREIENILKNNEYVASYNNSYHPRYGFGATEIILR